jgi:drug/metabolite transporter (DMT)-like permease
VAHSPSLAFYFAAQRLFIGVVCGGYLLAFPRPGGVLHYLRQRRILLLLLAVSVAELSAVALFLRSLQHLLVSYSIAIKRCSIVLSTLAGGILFGEPIRARLPYVLTMICGMLAIVLQSKPAGGGVEPDAGAALDGG